MPVWVALADLFLDNETQPFQYCYIANICRSSGYSRAELRAILMTEVGPVFAHNLTLMAGEWALWP